MLRFTIVSLNNFYICFSISFQQVPTPIICSLALSFATDLISFNSPYLYPRPSLLPLFVMRFSPVWSFLKYYVCLLVCNQLHSTLIVCSLIFVYFPTTLYSHCLLFSPLFLTTLHSYCLFSCSCYLLVILFTWFPSSLH